MSAATDSFDLRAEHNLPHAFIQWKGTDACFDFRCVCGANLHFDGWFAYYVQCGVCEAVWEMPSILFPRPATPEDRPLVRLEEEG